jgi:eukaryotic-like serine/threonine-protein kinase
MKENIPVIDGYEIIKKLGTNDAVSVWKARQVSLDRTVAIKILSVSGTNDPDDIQSFELEARTAAKLKHRGIVQIYDFGKQEKNGLYYFVMEYITGYTVGSWLRRKGKLKEADCAVLAHSVAEALKYAWEQFQLVHCDIKPDNIMVDGDGSIKITDLGIARAVNALEPTQHKTHILGTPNYMPPEQIAADQKVDYRADIYALGMSLHHMLTGVLPFANLKPRQIIKKQKTDKLTNLQQINPEFSIEFAELIDKMIEKKPEMRHKNWQEVINDLIKIEQKHFQAVDSKTSVFTQNQSGTTIPIKLSGEDKDIILCPNCSSKIPAASTICPVCGTKLQQNKNQLHLKPKPVAKKTGESESSAKPEKSNLRQWLGNIQILLTFAIVVFLLVHAFNKVVNRRDILIPVRRHFHYVFVPAVKNGFNNMADAVKDLFTPNPKQNRETGIAELVKSDSGYNECESYEQVLDICKDNLPSEDDYVQLVLKDSSVQVEGIVRKTDRNAVTIESEDGLVTYPFKDLTENSSLRFFPEKMADKIWEYKKTQ